MHEELAQAFADLFSTGDEQEQGLDALPGWAAPEPVEGAGVVGSDRGR